MWKPASSPEATAGGSDAAGACRLDPPGTWTHLTTNPLRSPSEPLWASGGRGRINLQRGLGLLHRVGRGAQGTAEPEPPSNGEAGAEVKYLQTLESGL